MNNTVFLPAPIFFLLQVVQLNWNFNLEKKGQFQVFYYCSTFSGWGAIK
jgi:hypothetical protein